MSHVFKAPLPPQAVPLPRGARGRLISFIHINLRVQPMCEYRYAVVGANARTVDGIERHGVDAALLHTGERAQRRVLIEP